MTEAPATPKGMLEQMMEGLAAHPVMQQMGMKPNITPDKQFVEIKMTAAQLRELIVKGNPKMACMELLLHEGEALLKIKL